MIGGLFSGLVVIVGVGLCFIVVGVDGGGSIWILVLLCGGYGIKFIFGCMSERGVVLLCWSFAHVGFIVVFVWDLVLVYVVMVGPDL